MSKAPAPPRESRRRFLPAWLKARWPRRAPPADERAVEADPIGAHVCAAISAYAEAKTRSADTYRARVDAMIDDLFTKYEEHHDRRHP